MSITVIEPTATSLLPVTREQAVRLFTEARITEAEIADEVIAWTFAGGLVLVADHSTASPVFSLALDPTPRGIIDLPQVDALEEHFDDDDVCHLRDNRIEGRLESLCRVPPSGKVAIHNTGTPDTAYCGGCGRPRCPECARLWREIGAAA